MDTRPASWWGRTRAGAGAIALLAAVAAATPGPAPTVAARQQSRPHYVFEMLFDVRPDAVQAFDRYWAALKDSAAEGAAGPPRFVDGQVHGSGRRVWLPVERLAEYSFDRRNEQMLRRSLGAAAAAVVQEFNQAQVSRRSYLRQYRDDLSVRRDHAVRTPAADVASVAVDEGKEPLFERAWRRVVAAHLAVRPAAILVVARTLVGGGPQYVVVRPLAVPAHGPGFRQDEAVDAVLEAFGAPAAREVSAAFAAAGAVWRTETYLNLGLDAVGAVARP